MADPFLGSKRQVGICGVAVRVSGDVTFLL